MTFHPFRLAQAARRGPCPICKRSGQLVTIVAFHGQCVTCTARLIAAAEHAAAVLAQKDLSLHFRALWATNILAGAHSPRPVISLSRRPLPTSRGFGGVR